MPLNTEIYLTANSLRERLVMDSLFLQNWAVLLKEEIHPRAALAVIRSVRERINDLDLDKI